MSPFPRCLSLLGLSPGFTQREFLEVMAMERSDEMRQLAHQEWESQQGPEFDRHNWRWHLSYVSMKTEFTRPDALYALNRYNSSTQP
tara:strand:+ start:514 stop:774 length:261 start_codon:yes stop_codon:yes gene_type:complete